MANLIISTTTMDPLEWTPVFAPGPCISLVVEAADPNANWAMSSSVDGAAGTTRTVYPGCAITITADGLGIQDDIPLFYVQGTGELVVTAGMGAQIQVTPTT